MSRIALNQPKRIITAAATTFTILGAIAAFKTDSSLAKNLSWVIAAGSALTGCVNEVSADFYEDLANDQAKKVIERKDKKILEYENKLEQNSKELIAKQLTVTEVENRLVVQGNRVDELVKIKSRLQSAVAQLEEELKNLRITRIDEKEQVEQALSVFATGIKQSLLAHIDSGSNRLRDSIEGRIKFFRRKDMKDGVAKHEHIIGVLGEQLLNISETQKHHQRWVTELSLDNVKGMEAFITDSLELFNQIHEEISSQKVKFRGSLSASDRLALKESIQKKQAIQALENLRMSFTESLDEVAQKTQEYEVVTANNDQFVQNLLQDIESTRIRLAQKDEELKELRKPIMWKVSPNQPTSAGNIIIIWCQSKGIHLDRSHYIGDRYEADLFFLTDRLSAAQTIDIKALNDEGENLAQVAFLLEPIKFTYDYESRLVKAHIVMLRREKAARTSQDFLQSPDKLLPFVRESYHVGIWGATGLGKTTLISNIIGGMVSDLGGAPVIRSTIPKIDESTREIFPHADWLGIPNSIFGLLESALEIQYRIHANEQAYTNGEPFPDFEPILFFIDEIGLIFSRWRRINDADLEDVIERFEETLEDEERLNYFRGYMRTELQNYPGEFAKRLLLFTWQTGRSLKVKSLIAGQNLQPKVFGLLVNDLENCAYIALGKSAKTCAKYKVSEFELEKINQQYEMIQKEIVTKPDLKFTALYCPFQGNSFFGILPSPNYYQWRKELLRPRHSNEAMSFSQELKPETLLQEGLDVLDADLDVLDGFLDGVSNDVQNVQRAEPLPANNRSHFVQMSKLPKKFQKLPYEALVQLWRELPKKTDGSVHKTQAYEKVFEVKRSEERRIVSDFIDYLEKEFK